MRAVCCNLELPVLVVATSCLLYETLMYCRLDVTVMLCAAGIIPQQYIMYVSILVLNVRAFLAHYSSISIVLYANTYRSTAVIMPAKSSGDKMYLFPRRSPAGKLQQACVRVGYVSSSSSLSAEALVRSPGCFYLFNNKYAHSQRGHYFAHAHNVCPPAAT